MRENSTHTPNGRFAAGNLGIIGAIRRPNSSRIERDEFSSLPTVEYLPPINDTVLLGGESCCVMTVEAGRDISVVMAGTIYNQNEISRGLQTRHPSLTDAQLLANCYAEYGNDFPALVNGDWAAAVWDHRLQQLLLARDQSGKRGLFYYYDKARFVFASRMKNLLAHRRVPSSVDHLHLVELLARWLPSRGETGTVFEQIHQLPPGYSVRACQDGTVESCKYWDLTRVSSFEAEGDRDFLAEFNLLFSEAVRCRIPSSGKVSVLMSGGLDSTSVALEASADLAKSGGDLLALTSVPRFSSDQIQAGDLLVDESNLAQAVANRASNIRLVLDDARGASAIDAVSAATTQLCSPVLAAGNLYWLYHLARRSKCQGRDVVLTGASGNISISWSEIGTTQALAREGKVARAVHDAYHRSRFLKVPAGPHVWRTAMRPWLGSTPLARLKRQIGGAAAAVPDEAVDLPDLILLNARIFASSDRFKLSVKKHKQEKPPLNPSDIRSNMIARWLSTMHGLVNVLETDERILICDPTSDPRLLEFCWAVPACEHYHRGVGRRLIRRAMMDRLPAEVINNSRKGKQAADLHLRLSEEHGKLQALVDDIEREPVTKEILNISRMKELVAAIGNREHPSSVECVYLLRAVSTGLFLRRFG